jgi:hypothetical protein
MYVNSGLAERFSVILRSTMALGSITYVSSVIWWIRGPARPYKTLQGPARPCKTLQKPLAFNYRVSCGACASVRANHAYAAVAKSTKAPRLIPGLSLSSD